MNKQEPSFFDSRTLFAIIFVVAIIFGWNAYLAKKYPQPQTPIATESKESPKAASSVPIQTETNSANKGFVENAEENVLNFDNPFLHLEISSYGMGIKKAVLKEYKDRKGENIVVGDQTGDAYLFELNVKAPNISRLNFDLKQTGPNEFVGYYKKGDLEIERKYTISQDQYTILAETKYNHVPYDVSILMPEKVTEDAGGGFLMPSYENQSIFVNHSNNSTERAVLAEKNAENPFSSEFSTVSVASIGSLYFTSALVDSSEISPFFNTKITTRDVEGSPHLDVVTGQVTYRFPSQNDANISKNKLYIGPKDIEVLRAADERLTGVVNFGWFGWISKPLLSMMKFFYSIFKNYGVAIILMTLIIRVLMLPLMISSYRSMKKMQTVQPMLLKIKEKYKDNPQQMQIETMSLYKTQGVNPVAGCLPMFLQLPIFMALYSLLGHSIELYKAPFMFWIQDLSFKDPYFVLPVLMGIAMFVQQKITPATTMDPAQQKVLMFMPIIFTFFMLALPSGLTLYMFVSSLFGIAQQHFFINDRKKQTQQPVVAQTVTRDI